MSENINLMPIVNKAYKEDFIEDKRIIGSSEIGYGVRKIVIQKCYGVEKITTMRMLTGKIVHKIFQQKEVRIPMINYINETLGYTTKNIGEYHFVQLDNENWMKIEILDEYEFKEKYPERKYIKIGEDRYLRQSPDLPILSLYIIEIKYTALYYKEFVKEEYLDRIFHYRIQLNLYLGLNGLSFGFLLIVNKDIFTTSSKNWTFIWNNYCRFIRVEFNQELFDLTIKELNYMFDAIEQEDFNVRCPSRIWECDPKYCSVRDGCKNPITKSKMNPKTDAKYGNVCYHCKNLIEFETTCIIRNGNIYHYTNEKGHPFSECVEACKQAWRVEQDD